MADHWLQDDKCRADSFLCWPHPRKMLRDKHQLSQSFFLVRPARARSALQLVREEILCRSACVPATLLVQVTKFEHVSTVMIVGVAVTDCAG